MQNLLYLPAILLGVVMYFLAAGVVHLFFGSVDPKTAAITVGVAVCLATFGSSAVWKDQDRSRGRSGQDRSQDRPRAILTIAFIIFLVAWIGMYSKFGTADIFNTQALEQHQQQQK
jgi:hypothetical protein